MTLLTIGHSTHPFPEFLALLRAHEVAAIADVRLLPRSRRHPHFSQERLAELLGTADIAYVHFPGLGGHRRPRPDSPNGSWRNQSFRGYADHMASPEFQAEMARLLALGAKTLAAVMCAESQWWRCHRQLIADALVARGIEVRHIMSGRAATPHVLTPFARVTGTDVYYPALDG